MLAEHAIEGLPFVLVFLAMTPRLGDVRKGARTELVAGSASTLVRMTDLGVFAALDHVFRLEVDAVLADHVADLLGGLAAPGAAPTVTYRVAVGQDGASTLYRDDAAHMSGELPEALQTLVTVIGLGAVEDLAALHGTTVVGRGRAALLIGPTGEGKTTVAARLLKDGWSLTAEDISAFDRSTGEVRPYHRPLSLSPLSFQLLGAQPPVGETTARGKVLVGPRDLDYDVHGSIRVSIAALLDSGSTDVEELTPAFMLARLLEAGVVQVPDPVSDLATLIDVLAASICLRLGSRDLDAAADQLEALVQQPTSDPPPTMVEARHGQVTAYCGGEAVVVEDARPRVHHLNRTAAAVWTLAGEGLDADQIVTETGADRHQVDAALSALDAAGLLT